MPQRVTERTWRVKSAHSRAFFRGRPQLPRSPNYGARSFFCLRYVRSGYAYYGTHRISTCDRHHCVDRGGAHICIHTFQNRKEDAEDAGYYCPLRDNVRPRYQQSPHNARCQLGSIRRDKGWLGRRLNRQMTCRRASTSASSWFAARY